jgi:hypothetical protein
MPKYKIIGEPDKHGNVKAKRADGKTGTFPQCWLKADGEGAFVPRSRTKAIRIRYFVEWN